KQDTPKNIPIGKPINNTQIYLLDDNLNLVPRSVVGELCISGDGLARGYLNNSKLTSQKFVDNPYLEGERLYKTGDLAKYLEDGNIEYVGRVDEQVKIRGFRIELGEIEQKLLSISNFKEGCVIVKNDEVLGKMLVAYVTVINNQDIDSKEVISHLERILPRHMIPSAVIKLKEMPLTLNGKIDKKYLSELDVIFISSEEYIEPQTNTQERLVRLFQEILDVDRVGIKDNFFDLGGHSLLATQLISKINREFNVQFQLKLLFDLGNI
ncbi:Non-ribosomal peptide synthetase modules and related proteins, partial [uncultured Gammaproteobacteria bacterium]